MAEVDYVRCMHGPKCPSDARVDGKTIIVTGSNTGIGKETARELAARGARVIMACRDTKKAQEAADDILQSLHEKPIANPGTVVVRRLDLASFASIREFATNIIDTESRLDILINNAGLGLCAKALTEDGLELQMGVNHFGTFLLTMLLLDKLKQSSPARIIIVSSTLHSRGKINFGDINSDVKYSPTFAYCDSKLANVLFCRELAKRLAGTGVTTYALHPGAVRTDIQRHLKSGNGPLGMSLLHKVISPFFKNPTEGAQTTIFCAVAEELKGSSGQYYSACKAETPSSRARNDADAFRLWNLSCELTKLDSRIINATSPSK